MTAAGLSDRARIIATAAGVALAALAFLAALRMLGEATILLAVLIVFAAIVAQHSGWALALALVPAVLIEDTSEGGLLPGLAGYYEKIQVVSGLEATIALLLVATAFDVARRGELRTPEPLTLPLLLLGAAIVSGAVVGVFNGAPPNEVGFAMRALVLLVLMPIVVVNVVRDRVTIRRVLVVAAALAAVKALAGIAAVIAGQGVENPGDPSLTYYAPAANWLAMAFLLVVLAVLVDRRRPPLWMIAIGVLSFASLLLSYRRSFWIAAVVGILIVALVGAGRHRWRVLVPGFAVLAAALWLTLNTGIVGDVQGPLTERAESLRPTEIQSDIQDRYRFGERRNVLEDLERNPVTGLGLAVPWTGRYPPSVDRPNSRDYVHLTALWWWLKLGILGLIAYVWLAGAGIWTSYSVWREQGDPWLRATGLGLFGALIGLALVETTGAFTGVNERFTVIIGAVLGLLCAMLADARREPSPGPREGDA